DQHGETIRYCHPHRTWYCWTGSRWQADQTGEIGRLAKKTVLQIHREADDEYDPDRREAIFEHAIRSQSAARIKAMIELARSEENVVVRPEDFDQNQWLLNCPNGTVDLRTG